MAQTDLEQALSSPVVEVTLAIIGLALVVMLAREVTRIPGKLLVLMATAFLDMVGMLMVLPLVPFYVDRLAGDGVQVFGSTLAAGQLTGIVVATFTLAQMISSPIWGRVSDRVGRRPALLVALGASAVAFVVFGFADSIGMLMLSRLIQGAGGGTVGVIQAYVADSTEPEQRAKALGWLSAATNLGVALGPVLGSQCVKLGQVDLLPGAGTLQLGNAAPGVMAAALCLINMVFAFRLLRESNTTSKAAASERSSPWRALSLVVRSAAPSSRLIWTYAVAIGAFQGTGAVLGLFLKNRFQVTELTIGYFYMFLGSISVFARAVLLGRMIDRFGEARLSRLGIVLLAAGLLGMGFAGSLPTLALSIALIPLGTAFTFPCVTAMLSRVVGANDRGLYMGLQQTYGGMARIVAPLFYGWAFDKLGIAVPYYFATGFVLLTLGFGFGLGRVVRAQTAS
jgi:MFS family permease